MFTLDQIRAAHASVKSGADFPAYVQDLIKLGLTGYETYVADGHSVFYGRDGFSLESPARYAPLTIADHSDQPAFERQLKAHQQGATDYLTFCRDSAALGVEKWVVSMAAMTCTYYSKAGEEILAEAIPVA
ncbi:MAG: DUF1398 family protein [Chitinophagaceae bacterium]